MEFEQDPHKAIKNIQKHNVSFTEAATVLGDGLSITIYDPDHSDNEDRYITIEWSNHRRLLMAAHTDRGSKIRIISARELTRKEREAYEKQRTK